MKKYTKFTKTKRKVMRTRQFYKKWTFIFRDSLGSAQTL